MANVVLRAKMRVESVVHNKDDKGETESEQVMLRAVYGADGTPNSQWSKWTPAGVIELTITNPDAINTLSRGHEFYIDFVPVTEHAPQ